MDHPRQTTEQLQTWLGREYGVLIDSASAAKVLGFRSAATPSKARRRGLVRLDMFKVPNRKGLFTSPQVLAAYLQATLPPHHLSKEAAMDGYPHPVAEKKKAPTRNWGFPEVA